MLACSAFIYPYCADGCFSNQSAFQWVLNDLRGYRRVDFAFTAKTGQFDIEYLYERRSRSNSTSAIDL